MNQVGCHFPYDSVMKDIGIHYYKQWDCKEEIDIELEYLHKFVEANWLS